jgi:hypothetical protein
MRGAERREKKNQPLTQTVSVLHPRSPSPSYPSAQQSAAGEGGGGDQSNGKRAPIAD